MPLLVPRKEGFTLIELLIAVLIIGILAAIALPAFNGARDRAKDREAQNHLEYGLRASKAVFADGEAFPSDSNSLAQMFSRAERSTSFVGGTTFPSDPRTVHVERVSAQRVILRGGSRSGKRLVLVHDEGAAATAGAAPTATVIRFSSASGAQLTNHSSNPSFETSAFVNTGAGNAIAASRSSAQRYSGSFSFAATMSAGSRPDGNQNKARFFASGLTPGSTYRASLWVMMPFDFQIGASQLNTSWYGTQYATARNVTATGDWQRVAIDFVPDATTANVWVGPNAITLGSDTTFYVDAVSITEGSTDYNYFDGSTPGASWTATAHESTSTGYPNNPAW